MGREVEEDVSEAESPDSLSRSDDEPLTHNQALAQLRSAMTELQQGLEDESERLVWYFI
jgi:hypothetical protein